jgi:hypothetical protein
MKVRTEIDNNFGYEKITQLVDNIPLSNVLFRNNKQHVALEQKRNCQRVEESGL